MALKIGTLLVKLEDDSGVDDHDIAMSINQMPCHLCSCILGHSKRSLNKIFCEIDGFYSNIIYYGDTSRAYNHKKHWSTSVEKSSVGKSLGLGKNNYGDAGISKKDNFYNY